MPSQYTYKDIANYFIALSNDTQNLITNLKLQKLVYYSQAWHLAIFSEPIFQDDFEAWVHGPVIPALYREYRHFTYNPIIEAQTTPSEEMFQSFNQDLQSVLNDVVEEYFGRTAYELEQLTHNEEPWIASRNGISSGESSSQLISKVTIKNYYSQLIATA